LTAFHVISNKNREDVNIDNGSLIAGRISKLLKSDFISFPHELEISPFAVNEELRNVSLGLDSKLCNGLESINEMWHPSLRQASEFGFLSIDFANVEEKIAVEFDGPTHYIEDLSLGPGHNKRYLRENGSTAFKTRLLKKCGWKVVRIPYFDISNMFTVEERVKYLKAKLGLAGRRET